MPPWILAAIPAAIGAIVTVTTLALVVGPFLVPLWAATMGEARRKQIAAAVKGANDALGPFIRTTPTDIDDRILAVSEMVVRELGKVGAKNADKVKAIAAGVVAKAAAQPLSTSSLAKYGPNAKVRP